MKSVVLLASSALLLVSLANGQAPDDFINCDLQYGTGCDASGPNFFLDFKSINPGPSSQCRRAYDLLVIPDPGALGFECSFVTDGSPQQGTYRYTVSHNATLYRDDRTAHIRVYGDNALMKMQSGTGRYANNWWYIPKMHASNGYSFATYQFKPRYLQYYSSNVGIQHQSGHARGFRSPFRPTYIGLNKAHGSSSRGGYGLCQIYCVILRASNAPLAAPGSPPSVEDTDAPAAPTPPPPRPSQPAPLNVIQN